MKMRGVLGIGIVFAILIASCKQPSTGSSDEDTTPPAIGAGISIAGVSATSATVSWGAATDDGTSASRLLYKLVVSNTSSAIDSVKEADAAKGAKLVMGWTKNALGSSVTGLSADTTYFFAVVVKDDAGNESLYSPRSITTAASPDPNPPSVGTAISFSGTSSAATTVSWGEASDDLTPAAGLQYKLVKAAAAAAIDTPAEANAISGADLVMNWTAGTVSKSATSLTANTTYYFAVLVRDAAGNMSLYAPQSVMTTATADTTPPTIGTGIVFSATTCTSTTVAWGAASDDITLPPGIQYKLVKASSQAAIDSVAEANAIGGADLVMDWTTNALSKAASGLAPSTTYWFAVLARDAAGNMCLYAPKSVATTADTTAPDIGGTIGFSSTTATGTAISWNAASDNVTAQTSLQYKLVKASSQAAIDTVAAANAIGGADLVMDWTANTLNKSATGLIEGTAYWFAVLVKDAAGNMSLYAPQSVTTLDATAPAAGTDASFSGTTATGTTVSWGAATDSVTAQASLQYKLVKAISLAAIDSVAEANSIGGADLVMDWTTNALSKAASGLAPSTTYWFAVLARDAAGNMSLYAPKSVATTADTTAPAAGTGLSYSGTTATGTTVSWGAATDDATPQASLQYKLVKASAQTAIDTVAEADAVTGADLAMDWTSNALTKSASGLSPSTTYYFAALVRDAAGNIGIYAPQSVTTSLDTSAPTIGTAISSSGTTYTSTTLSWGVAADDVTPAASLRYKLVMASASTDIDSVAEANAINSGTGLVMDWTNNTLSKAATGLADGTTYWFAVIVQDAAGNMSLYAPKSVATPASTDTTSPTVGTAIAFASTTITGTTASWGAASDNVTATASLQYKLVKASASTAIDTVAEVDAIGGADLVMDWTTAVTSKAATGLSPATTYYFAAIVKDAAGNMSIYSPQSVTTSSDTTAPTTGTAITLSNISSSSMTASWGAASDNVTAQSNLQYKLVRASSLDKIETVALANGSGSGVVIVMDWTTNTTTKSVTGLTASTYYYFAVIVRDAAGNMSLYDVKWAQTSTVADTTPPTPGTGISFSGISSNTATVSWGAGTDDVTAQASLQYRLVKASTQGAIDTVAEVNAITGADLVMDWTTNATSTSATGLSPSTTYYFSVVVRDATGNSSLYSPQSTTTTAAPDTTAPTTGTGISFSGTTSTSTTVNWGAGSDNVTPQASLQYKLVRASSSSSIDTVAEADAISDSNLIMDWTTAATSKTANGLAAGNTYYFAAIVKDATGNKSLYSPASVTTSTTSNLVYSLSSNPGWTVTGDWQWGTVTMTEDDGSGGNRYPTGSTCLGTGLYAKYSPNMTFATNYVQAGPLNFSSFSTAAGFRMNFEGWFYVQNGSDFDVLQYSTDGTTFTFVPASCVSGYAYCPNPDPAIPPQESWSPNWADAGSLPAWRSVRIDLGGIALNGKTTVYFRWALSTTATVNKGGFFIKDIDIGY